MSSTTSSSSTSRSQRPPLHERSNSEKNKLAIRIVPYSPPRLDSQPGSSHAPGTGTGHGDAHHTTNDPTSSSPTRRKPSPTAPELNATSPGFGVSSPSSSRVSLVRAQARDVSGTKPGSDSSGVDPSTPPPAPALIKPSYGSNISRVNASSKSSQHDDEPASPTGKTPKSGRHEKVIAVHSDKTFSIVLKPTGARVSDKTDSSLRSPPLSNYSTVSSHERISFDAPTEDRPSSALSSLAERSVSPYTPGSAVSAERAEDLKTTSPWNYHMVGGLRKVANTPDFNQKGKDKEVVGAYSSLPPLPEVSPSSSQPSSLARKPSFNSDVSEQTESAIEETTNYKILGRSSPLLPYSDSIEAPPSSSDSNYRLLGESSPAQTFTSSPAQALLDTPGSKNYIVHGDPTPSSFATPSRRPRPQYSDESLVLREKQSQDSLLVPPLNTRRRSSHERERVGYFTQRSRESLRRASSFSSISSVLSQDVTSVFQSSTPNLVRLHSTLSPSPAPNSSWAGSSSIAPLRSRMDAHPHQWSSQLSTVPSETEGSDRGSRHLSVSSAADYRSNSYGSRHSRQMLSISSSLAAAEEQSDSRSHSRSHSWSDSLDRPGPAYMRGAREPPTPTTRMVRDVDEHGDGLADLHHLQHKSSRPRLGHLLSPKSSDRNLHSSASSRAGSFTAASIPTWARLYYGSGERRWLAAPSIRSYSDDSRPGSSWGGSSSPMNDQFPPNILSPRRRPREVYPEERPVSMEITPGAFGTVRLGVRRMTSSIWSPHLEQDRRASRLTMWQPPSMTWSADSGPFGRRNIQIVLFSVGFIFPFAWMIAALLPLPAKPVPEMSERDRSTTQFGIPDEPEPFARPLNTLDTFKYNSARWWRNLNRIMSVIGLLLLGAIVALVVVGLRQNWGRR